MNPPTPKEQIEALQSELIQLRKRGDRTESRQDNRHAESEILGKLGIAYYQDQQWHSAIATLTEYLNLARELGNQTNEAVAHYYLGFTQQAIADFEPAVKAFFQGYRLFRQLQQHQFAAPLWQQLVQQGQRYVQNQQFPEAVALYKRQIQVLLEFDDLKASAEIAVELGKLYYSQPDFPEAIGCFTSALDTAQTLKDQTLENQALAWLGYSHWQGGDLSQGLQYLEQRLALVQQLENTAAQQETLTWLIQICQQLDNPDKLIQSYQFQANFWQQQGEPANQHISLYELAIYQFNRQQYPEALSGFQIALELANTLNDDQGKSWKTANNNYMVGECYRNLGENQAAIFPYQQAVEFYLQLGAKEWAEKGLGHLLNLYRELQQAEQEIDCQKKRFQLIQDRGDNITAYSLAYGIGNLYNNRQQFTQALEYYQEALILAKNLEPQQNLANAAYMVADCYRNLGQQQAAISGYEQAVGLYVEVKETKWALSGLDYLVNLYRELKQDEQVIASYQRRLEIFRELGDRISEYSCLYELARFQFNTQKYQEALSGFETALQFADTLDEDSSNTYNIANSQYMLGDCYRNLGQQQDAISWYEQAVELYVEVKETKWALSGLDYLVNLYRELKQDEQVIASYQRRLEIFRELGDRTAEQSCLYNLAMWQFDSQQYQDALSGFEAALQLAETLEGDAHKNYKIASSSYMVGDCYRNLGQPLAAITWYEQAVGLYVEVKETKWALSGLDYLVNLYRQLKQDEQVIASYQRRLEIFRELGDRTSAYSCLYKLASFQFDCQQYQDAVSGFEAALQLAETLEGDAHKNYKIASSSYMVGDCYRNLGQPLAAITWYEEAVGLYVEVKETKWALSGLDYLVNLYRELKQDQQVIASYQRRLEIFRETGERIGENNCLYELARFQFNTQEYQEALSGFETALQIAESLDEGRDRTYRIANSRYMLARCYEQLKHFHKAVQNYQISRQLYQEVNDIKWMATASHSSANIYLYDYPIEKAESIEQAIGIYQENLTAYSRETYSQDWAKTQNALGNAYFKRILGDKAGNLEIAIRHYEAALEVYTRQAYPEDWAYTQNSLGIAYEKRIRGDKADNLEKAIAYYNAALEIRTREAYPENWAYTQNSLGLTYLSRIRGDKADNLEKGIAAFNAALQVYTHENLPEDWAMVQTNLGIGYTFRIRGQEAENVEIGISYHNAALTVYNREEYPQDWAMVQMNLGLAYSNRIHGEKAENQEISLAFYNAALEVLTRKEFPEYWAKVQLNLGVAYFNRIQGDKAENLEKAISFDNAAVEVFTQDAFPQYWAMVQKSLGINYRKRIKGQKAQNLEIAIAYYNAALQIYTRESYPEDWASLQKRLGNIYQYLGREEKADNLERAFRYYNVALEVYTREGYPEDWAAVQNDLGTYYYRKPGDKTKNLEMAIAAYERALEVNSYFETSPEDWAITQNNLGNAYQNRIRGEKAHNLEMAIAAYKSALIVRTPEKYTELWADTQYKLGVTYFNRIEGEKADNIEKAIIAYENALDFYIQKLYSKKEDITGTHFDLDSQQIIEDESNNLNSSLVIREVESGFNEDNSWSTLCVSLQMNLANSYVNRIKGDKSENLGKAIDYHKASLKLRPREYFREEWAEIKFILGLAYTDKIVTNQDERFLSEAIRCYQAAVEIRTLEKVPNQWAEIQFFIGSSYNFSDPSNLEYREQAIIAYEAALTVYSPKNNPQRWAEIQNFLGVIYSRRTLGTMADNIEKSLAYHQFALTIYTKEVFPEKWADTQNYLGVAYSHRIQGDKSDNIEKSIAAHEQAFTVFTKDAYPKEWAHTQNYFATAHLFRILGKKSDNLQRAINCYQSALTVFTKEQYPEQWAMCQNNLAEVYKNRRLGNQQENLRKALAACLASLELHDKHKEPEGWGRINLNLGDIYIEISNYENTEESLIKARFYYEQGLTVFTRDSYPERWATAQRCLSNTYNIRMTGNSKYDLDRVVELYNNSLQVFTQSAFPEEYAETLFHLGITYLNLQDRQSAYDAFAEAIDTVDYLRGDIISGDEAKRKINEQWVELYILMVKVCIELNRYDKALEYADRSKARNLSELIAARDLYGSDIPESTRLRLQQIRQDIAKEKERLQQTSQPNSNHLNQLREEFNRLSPYQPLTLENIQKLLNEETAIIEWYVSFQFNQFLTFTILPNFTNQPSQADSGISLWQSSPEDFKNLIDWGNAYIHDYRNNKTQWHNQLPQRLEQLAQILHLDEILHNLREKFPNCKKLILIPHRFLHLFPLHALPVPVIATDGVGTQCLRPISRQNGNQEGLHIAPLQELFPKGVAYAPNCQVLQQAQKRINQRPDFNQLFAIQNPTQDLDFTDIEVAAIQSLFNPHHILQYDAAEKAAILDGDNLKNAHCTHFSCHGYFNFEDALKSALLLAKSEFTPPPPNEDQSRYIPLQNGNLLDLGKCLTIEDILRLDLSNCRLVTLSACETGITDFTSSSDEYIGLPSGFILAGAPNVVCSLWAVNDLSTALLMIRFYQNVKTGETVPLALKQAQIWLRDVTVEGVQVWSEPILAILDPFSQEDLRCRLSKMDLRSKPFASPYYWAGFCAIGV